MLLQFPVGELQVTLGKPALASSSLIVWVERGEIRSDRGQPRRGWTVDDVGLGVPELGVTQGHTLGTPAGTPARNVEDVDTHCCWSIWHMVADAYSGTSCLNMKRFY